jgi:DNA-binding response OmpR family regulator
VSQLPNEPAAPPADILVVDDDVDTADALADVLQVEGHRVRVGYDGEQALRLLQERLPDLVLLDVEMPNLDGPGLAFQMILRDCGQELIPVAFLSGVQDLRQIAAQVGTPYFLQKPYRYEHVMTLVSKALRERSAPNPAWLEQRLAL